jgi:hypothetical protein
MSSRPGRAALTVVLDNGTQHTERYALPPHARLSVSIARDFAAQVARGQRFSALVESEEVDGTAVPLVVEVSRYQSADGLFGVGGGAALATRIE